ncbi:leucine-rich repeat and IQ domain-containing protein 3 [Myotis myotis]|uniref:Leucine rich repeats and IQ motif containing 3 n=1 Tax=Myotis myotis TaxID=51298 RepID=A0A7J7ZZR6_MYOMY|nr:leucine-rich repeat and IQ domain-containing protein 3 [Myotis myotis]KAF6379240.1 leucine rich repeats and IQ motif containing 3 [Myotis myotis]
MFHATVTKELISHKEWSHYNENIIEDQKDFVFVKYTGLHLKSMENLQSCISLKICIFSNNFITNISPIGSCIKLVKLDLHGNQIKSLPDVRFWSRLKSLKLLYLHDNGFAKLKNVCMLSACPSLIALTLFDCPVSLKKGYRHVLVNTILPLKALDHYVISDEEIVQNFHLPERFKTYNHRLFFNFCPPLKKGSTYEDEINNINFVISKINEIMAHNSPILIIQRWIRGFLVRKILSHYFSYKKPQEKFISECKTKWAYKHKRYEDMIFKDLSIKPETNITGKLARKKHNILSPVDLISSNKKKKHVSSLLSELKTKDIGKKSRHLIQKGQESEDEIEDGDLHASFRISVFKLPIHSSDSLKDVVLKKKEQASFPTYTQPLSTTHQKPVITKPHVLLEKKARREFFMIHRTGIKLKTLYDIDEYHLEQKKQESPKKNGIAITMAKTAQEKVNLSVQEMLQKKKRAVQKQMAEDNRAIRDGLYQLWQVRSNYLEKVRERRALFLEEKDQKARDRLLIQNLNNELIIWDRSVNKMKTLKKNNDLLKEKHLIVQEKRETEKLQKDLRKYMKELRARESCKRHSEEKFVYDMIAFQKACERLQEAKANIESMKTKVVVKTPRK